MTCSGNDVTFIFLDDVGIAVVKLFVSSTRSAILASWFSLQANKLIVNNMSRFVFSFSLFLFLGLAFQNFADASRILAFLHSNEKFTKTKTCSSTIVNHQSPKQASTRLFFGIPSFLTPPPPNNDEKNKDPKKTKQASLGEDKSVGLKGLVQLIMAGAGAPFLGDFEGVDKETGKFMFSLEANNLVDEDGKSKQTAMPYFENGWVDPADLEREERRKKGGFQLPW
jgi:hypothetical protein